MAQFNGPSLEEIYGNLDQGRQDELVARYREVMLEKHDEMIGIFPGIKEVLENLKQEGLSLGVVSTKRSDVLKRGIAILGITDYFDTILGSGDFSQPKPDPESLFLAMERLDAERETSVMVGDNHHDIVAGNNAGVTSIFVGWSEKTTAFIQPYRPTKIVNDPQELEEYILSGVRV
jgi:pyrophosphatase PpaX